MNKTNCPICTGLRALGVKVTPADDFPWIDSPVSGYEKLEIFATKGGHAKTWQICRCPECGTLYRYGYHSEYDVSGSWEEYSTWEMGTEAQILIGELLTAPIDSRAQKLIAALQHPDKSLREDAALVLWIFVDEGDLVGDALLSQVCETLSDKEFMIGNYCYYALLTYAYRGAESAQRLQMMLDRTIIGYQDRNFSSILSAECKAICNRGVH